ncbi:glycosyltransferase [Kriegella sp. EG-1]|nr:glycosyltransferase [Flavobacteriaceae bacterium EG-1]
MDLSFSFVIPVYNRPDEVRELLESMCQQTYNKPFEVVIVEDGSTLSSKDVIADFSDRLHLSYYEKENSGPGPSRNYGMERANGNYFIILDSDCILPPQYLVEVNNALHANFVECYGGPDAANQSFTTVQKAINFAMTSILTTGGIRGNTASIGKFQPRSFNMGLSKEVFKKVGGYGKIHPGEDPDLTFRIWKAGYESSLFSKAFVYHKRRINWNKFYTQVNKFGMVRPILNKWHPETAKITYWFPTVFCLSFIVAVLLYFLGIQLPLWFFGVYFILIFSDSIIRNKSLSIAVLSIFAVIVQFIGYGTGFLKSSFLINFSKRKPQEIFPNLFFK